MYILCNGIQTLPLQSRWHIHTKCHYVMHGTLPVDCPLDQILWTHWEPIYSQIQQHWLYVCVLAVFDTFNWEALLNHTRFFSKQDFALYLWCHYLMETIFPQINSWWMFLPRALIRKANSCWRRRHVAHKKWSTYWQSLYMQKSLWLQPTLTKLKMKRFILESTAILQLPQNIQTWWLRF